MFRETLVAAQVLEPESADGLSRILQTTPVYGFNANTPSPTTAAAKLGFCLSHHINFASLRGKAIKKLKAKKSSGSVRFAKGDPSIPMRVDTWLDLTESVDLYIYILLADS